MERAAGAANEDLGFWAMGESEASSDKEKRPREIYLVWELSSDSGEDVLGDALGFYMGVADARGQLT